MRYHVEDVLKIRLILTMKFSLLPLEQLQAERHRYRYSVSPCTFPPDWTPLDDNTATTQNALKLSISSSEATESFTAFFRCGGSVMSVNNISHTWRLISFEMVQSIDDSHDSLFVSVIFRSHLFPQMRSLSEMPAILR